MALAWICSCFTGLQVERNQSLGQEDAQREVKGRVYLEIKEQPAGDFSGALQQALCSVSQERLVERRAKALVQTLYNHLGAQAVVRLYGVTDEGGDRLSLVLLSSASNSGRESEDERSGTHIPLAPAQKRAGPLAHLQDMMHTALAYKAPVTRRGPDTAAVAVALPLLLGQNVGGVLWIQQPGTTASATAAAAISAVAVNPDAAAGHAGLLHGPRDLDLDLDLEHLALSASILLSAGAPDAAQHLADLSSALRRLADSTTLKALVSELCAILAAHVRRNFLLDAVVRAAIVPVAGAQVGFLLEDDSPSARWGGGGPASGAAVLPGPVALAAAALLVSASVDPGGGGGDSMYGGGGGAAATAMSGSCLANSGSHSAGVAPALGSRGRRGSCLEGNGPLHGPAPAAAAAGNADAAALGGVRRSSSEVNLARAARTALFHNLPRPMGNLAPAPHTLDATPASGRGRTSRCPTAVQMGGRLLSPPGRPSTGLGMGPVSDPVAMSLGFNTAVPLAALCARPVRLSDTLLNAMMHRGASATTSAVAAAGGEAAAAAATLRDAEQSNVDGGGVEGGGGGGRVLVGDVVADCLQYVQCIRLPSRDVYMLLNMTGGGGRDTTPGLYDSTGASASQASSTRGRYTVLGLTASAPTVAPSASQQPPASGGGSGGGVRSLALLGVATEGGQVLGVYVSFPTTLPRHMLLAVRDSCADLLDAVLAAQVRHKLREQCASEIETLAAGVPGNYVIVPSGKIPEAAGGGGGGAQAVGANSGDGGGGGAAAAAAAAVTACVSIIRRQHSQLHQLVEDERPSPLLSESHLLPEMPRTMLSPNAGSTAATVPSVGLLGGTAAAVWNAEGAPSAGGPTVAASFRLAHRAPGGASPGRSHSALHLRHRSLSLWEAGSGDTSSHAVTTSGAHATTQGFSRGGDPTSGQGTSAVLAASTGNFAALRRDGTGMAEAALPGGGMETVSNDAALLTLLGADCGEGTARAQLCLLVESVMSTLRDSAVAPGIEDLYDMSSFDVKTGGVGGGGVFRPLHDDMDELVLTTMVGTGASGVVLMGQLATVPVAVKLMELPPGAFSEGGAAAGAAGDGDGSATTGRHPRKSSDVAAATSSSGASTSGSGGGGPPPPQQQKRLADAQRRFDARRSLLRSATELAVLRSVSHINIVQVYAVYSNVALNRITNDQGEMSYKLQYRRGGEAHNTHDTDECPPCVAVCMEFADAGSLEGVLTQRTFPRWMPQQQQPQDRRNGGAAPQGEATLQVDLKGVYLTLLEIALALRHLHSRRLAHRDVKPANILLKSNPRDPRGWNCKLADFGFAIVLDRQQPLESSSGLGFFALQEQACGTVTHMAPEALQAGARIDSSVDIFSLGIIMWELVAGRGHRPYIHTEQQDIPPAVRSGMRPIFPEGLVPAQYSTMAQACWSAEPHKRPTAADVVSFAKEQLEQLSAQAAMRRRHAHAAATAAATGGAGA